VTSVAVRTTLKRRTRSVLFLAFAFAVMADPVSSVAYAIEAALRALGAHLLTATNLLGALAVAFKLVVNPARGYPLLALAGTALIAGLLYSRWVRAGRPAGLEEIERHAEED
jgi:hypothetical protein